MLLKPLSQSNESYTVSFQMNGYGTQIDPITATMGKVYPSVTNPTEKGYSFLGWYLEPEFKTKVELGSTIMDTPYNHVLYAKWDVGQYIELEFISKHPSDPYTGELYGEETSILVKVESSSDVFDLSQVSQFSRPGYTQDGWSGYLAFFNEGSTGLDKTYLYGEFDIGTYYDNFMNIPAEDYSDYVVYKIVFFPNWCTNQDISLRFLKGDISSDDDLETINVAVYSKKQTIVLEDEPDKKYYKEGYTQTGWSKTDGGAKAYDLNANFNENVDTVLYPVWEQNKYTVTFNYNDATSGASTTSKEVTYGEEVGTLPAPEKTGNTFKGWKDGEGNTYEADTEYAVTNDLVLYAQWEEIDYTITFHENSGSDVEDITAKYNATVVEPTEPERLGYTFDGWYEKSDLSGVKYAFTKMPAKNVDLYAKWNINTYTISYNLDGGSVSGTNPTTYSVTTATFALVTE